MAQTHDPSQTGGEDAETAPARGHIPTGTAAVILLAVVGVAGWVGVQSGYNRTAIGLLLVTGTLASVGKRLQQTTSTRCVFAGVGVAWVSAVGFAGGAGLLFLNLSQLSIAGILAGVFVLFGLFLAPYGIMLAVLQTEGLEGPSGHGDARPYTSTIVSFGLLLIAVGTVDVLLTNLNLGVGTITAPISGDVVSETDLLGSVTVGGVVYLGVLRAVQKVSAEFPYSVFVTPENISEIEAKIDQANDVITKLYIGVLIWGGSILSGTIVLLSPAAPMWSEQLRNVLSMVVRVTAHQILVLGGVSAIAVLLVALAILRLSKKVSTWSAGGFAVLVAIPGLVLGAVLVVDSVAGGIETVHPAIRNLQQVGGVGVDPVWVVLFGVLAGNIGYWGLTGVIGELRTHSAGEGPLSDMTVATTGLLVMVIVAGIHRLGVTTIFGGTLVAVVVWELSEYTIVATGELSPPARHTSGTPDVGYLTTIHGLASVAMFGFGIAITVLTILLVPLLALPSGLGAELLIPLVIGVGACLYLLSG